MTETRQTERKNLKDRIESRWRASNSRLLSKAYFKIRNWRSRKQFISLSQEISDIRAWIAQMPGDFDIVVGIPRTGLLTASLVAAEFGKPLSTPDLIIQDKYWMTDHNRRAIDLSAPRILLVDDSIGGGSAMIEAENLIKQAKPSFHILKGATYIREAWKNKADFYFTCLKHQPLWLRSLMHGKIVNCIAFDMDGVLCMDYRAEPDYLEWLRNVKPHKIPIYEIDYIITGRLERFRADTQEWLARHKVAYRTLLMRPHEDEPIFEFKSRSIVREKPLAFVESDPDEARRIHQRTGIRVLCLGNEKVYD